MKIFLIILMFLPLTTYAVNDECESECQKLRTQVETESSLSLINRVWIQPETLENQCKSFPYFPKGGINSAYCFIKTYIPISVAEKISGHKVFLSSPHKNDSIVSTNEEFGHYNPDFLNWGIINILPVVEDEAVNGIVKSTYESFFSYSAKTYYMVWLQLQENSDENIKIKQDIKEKIFNKQYYDTEKYYSFLQEDYYTYPGLKWSGNIAKTAVPFWIRREIDGTSGLFIQALERIFYNYDPEFMGFVSQLSNNKAK